MVIIKQIEIMKTFNTQAINDFYTELEIINKREDNGELDMEDYEIERQQLLLSSLCSYFNGKYFDLNDKSVRIADHKQGTVYHSSSDFSFVVKRASSSTGTDFTISYNEDINDAIDFILKTVK
jgi:hypothetical protein